MKCGEKTGHVTRAGALCQQNIAANAAGCIWYVRDAAGRSLLATRGSIASRMRRALPSSYHIPEFASPQTIITFSRELARLALVEDVDLRRVAEARGAASLALSAHQAQTQQQLVDALLTIEHGGAAVALLAQLKAADGPKRLLPWKVPPAVPSASAPTGSSSSPEAEGA